VDRYQMIPVAFTRSGFEAKVIAAQLGSEGIVWELRGDVDGLYPVGGIEVLVPSDEADRARDVLAEPADDQPELWPGPDAGSGDLAVQVSHRHRPAVVAAALVLAVAFVAVRLLAMG
jgi:hypothetical protein